MGIWMRRGMTVTLMVGLGWGVYRETGPVTTGVVLVVLIAIAGLDRRTRAMQGHSFGKMAEMLDGLQNGDPVKLPDEEKDS